MPEGDALHRTAERLRALEGEVLAVESPHPRAAALAIASRIDGRRLERVEAVGKNLVLSFEGGLVLRSHLRMRGRWRILPLHRRPFGTPWLVLRGRDRQAVLWHGPVLELSRGRPRALAGLGPDVMVDPPQVEAMLRRIRSVDQRREVGEALLDQRLVAGIGNVWKAETLFRAEISPWACLVELDDDQLRSILRLASVLMQGERPRRAVYRRSGLPCRRCATIIRSRAQGDEARTAYWCPRCQAGTRPAGA